jgi:Cys-rich repeat protein
MDGGDDGSTDGGGGVAEAGTLCTSETTCTSAGIVCDLTLHVCVQCTSPAECGSGQSCIAGTCTARTLCTSSNQCPGVCSNGSCVDCATNADCLSGFGCFQNQCFMACQSDTGCKDAGDVCDTADAGVCVACNTDADCNAGHHCASNLCKANACQPGVSVCYGNAVYTCNASGSGYNAPMDCGTGVCASTGSSAACVPLDAGAG